MPLSNKDIVTFLRIPISSLQRRIKAETDYLIMRYLLNLRIEKACILLVSDSDNIEQIALSVGYEFHCALVRYFERSQPCYRKNIDLKLNRFN